MVAVYDVPWWGWPITAAIVGVSGAVLVAWLAFVFNRHLKLLDASRTVGEKLASLNEGIELACLQDPSFGDRLASIGGWDALATRLKDLKAAVEILEIYGDKQVAQAGIKLFASSVALYDRVHTSVALSKTVWKGMSEEHRDQHFNAQRFLIDKTKADDVEKLWKEYVGHVNTSLRHTITRTSDYDLKT